ncbi:MAG: molybdopterin-dependent oxidoreductase [Candidatus Velthaea sp.]
MNTRARFIQGAGAAGLALATGSVARAAAPQLDVVIERPYDWGTPLGSFGTKLYTPNREFFIRSHMGPPPSIDMKSWRLRIGGLVGHPLALSLADIKAMEHVEIPAVLQCSGNGRYFYGEAYPRASHPAGAQWKFGSVGNARWTGVRVRDIIARAKPLAGAKFANNNGLDNPLFPTTPKFIRGIELEKLMDPDSIVAFAMNGEPLPYYHGFPVRLIVPGWAADHWVKWLTDIRLSATITDDFWTSVAYRYPNKPGAPGKGVAPTQEHPVLGLNVKSIITGPADGASVKRGSRVVVTGFAWSGDGATVSRVEISADGGKTWRDAALGTLPGKYSWQPFTFGFVPDTTGTVRILARATDNRGATQPRVSPWNPSGYLWNGIHAVAIEVA